MFPFNNNNISSQNNNNNNSTFASPSPFPPERRRSSSMSVSSSSQNFQNKRSLSSSLSSSSSSSSSISNFFKRRGSSSNSTTSIMNSSNTVHHYSVSCSFDKLLTLTLLPVNNQINSNNEDNSNNTDPTFLLGGECNKIRIEEDSSGQHWICMSIMMIVNNNVNDDDEEGKRMKKELQKRFVRECCVEKDQIMLEDTSSLFKKPHLLSTRASSSNRNNNNFSSSFSRASSQQSSLSLSSSSSVSSQQQLFQQKQSQSQSQRKMFDMMMSIGNSNNHSSLSQKQKHSNDNDENTSSSQTTQNNNIIFKTVYLKISDDVMENEDSFDNIINNQQQQQQSKLYYFGTRSPMKISSASIRFLHLYFSIFVETISVTKRRTSPKKTNWDSSMMISAFSINSMTFGNHNNNNNNTSHLQQSSKNGTDSSNGSAGLSDAVDSECSSNSNVFMPCIHQQMVVSSSTGTKVTLCLNPASALIEPPSLNVLDYANIFFFYPNHYQPPSSSSSTKSSTSSTNNQNNILSSSSSSSAGTNNFHRMNYFTSASMLPKMLRWLLENLRHDSSFYLNALMTMKRKKKWKNNNCSVESFNEIEDLIKKSASNPLPQFLRDAQRSTKAVDFIKKVLVVFIEKLKIAKKKNKKQQQQNKNRPRSNVDDDGTSSSSQFSAISGNVVNNNNVDDHESILRPSQIVEFLLTLIRVCWKLSSSSATATTHHQQRESNGGHDDDDDDENQNTSTNLETLLMRFILQGEDPNAPKISDLETKDLIEKFLAKTEESESDEIFKNIILETKTQRGGIGFLSFYFFDDNANNNSKSSSSSFNNNRIQSLVRNIFCFNNHNNDHPSTNGSSSLWSTTPLAFVEIPHFVIVHDNNNTSSMIECKFPIHGLLDPKNTNNFYSEIRSLAIIVSSTSSLSSFSSCEKTIISQLIQTCLRKIALRSPLVFLPISSSSSSSSTNSTNNSNKRDATTKRVMTQALAPAMVQSICNIIERSGSRKFKEDVCKVLELVEDDDNHDDEDDDDETTRLFAPPPAHRRIVLPPSSAIHAAIEKLLLS